MVMLLTLLLVGGALGIGAAWLLLHAVGALGFETNPSPDAGTLSKVLTDLAS